MPLAQAGCRAQGFGAGDQSGEGIGFGARLGLQSEARAGRLSGQAIPVGRAPQPGAGAGVGASSLLWGSPARTPVTCWRCSKVGLRMGPQPRRRRTPWEGMRDPGRRVEGRAEQRDCPPSTCAQDSALSHGLAA